MEALRKFLPYQVSPFGHYLGVPFEVIEIIKSKNDTPQQQAFEIYQVWENYDVNYKGHRQTFIHALNHCGHGRAASNLPLSSQHIRHRTTAGGGK